MLKRIKNPPNFWKKFPSFKQLDGLALYGETIPDEGNDPPLNIESLDTTAHQRILLIATSRLRAVEMACRMTCKEVKILIIDNSVYAYFAWQSYKLFMMPEHCVEEDRNRLKSNSFLNGLIEQYGFKRVYNLIKHAKFISQDWGNEETFSTLIDHYAPHYDKIYVYPSNIVAFLSDNGQPDKARQVLRNIDKLNPDVAFHTNMPNPTTWIIVKKNEHIPEHLMQLLGCSNELVVYTR